MEACPQFALLKPAQLTGLFAVIVAIGVAAYLAFSGPEPQDLDQSPVKEQAAPAAREPSPKAEEHSTTEASVETPDSAELAPQGERQVATAPDGQMRLAGQVTDANGRPLGGATVSFTPSELLVDGAAYSAGTAQELEAAMTYGSANAAGGFVLNVEGERPGVVWATAPGHEAAFAWTDGALAGIELQLNPAGPINIKVSRSDDGDLNSAAVLHRGRVYGNKALDKLTSKERAELLYFRRYPLTDVAPTETLGEASGQVVVEVEIEVPSTSTPQHVWAVAPDGAISLREAAATNEVVELFLSKSFTLEVEVADFDPEVDEVPKLTVSVPDGPQREFMLDLGPEGTGSYELPVLSEPRYTFSLGSRIWALQSRVINMPAAGAVVNLTFEREPGLSVPLQFLDYDEQPISDVKVGAYTETEPGVWPNNAPVAMTDGEGRVDLPGLRSGVEYWSSYTHDDYVGGFAGPLVYEDFVPSAEGDGLEPFVVYLQEKMVIRGRVEHLGEALEGFEILAWPATSSALDQLDLDVRYTAGGGFTIEVPKQDTMVIAWKQGLCESPRVMVRADDPQEVLLEIGEQARGRGRILSSESWEPLTGAVVRAYVIGGNYQAGIAPDEVLTDSMGSFEIDGLRTFGFNMVSVQAPDGRSSSAAALPQQRPDGTWQTDFGDIIFDAIGSLEVAVRGYAGEGQLSIARNYGRDEATPLVLEGDVHRATIEGIRTGELALELLENGAVIERRRFSYLGDSGYAVEFDLTTGADLTVDLSSITADEYMVAQAHALLENGRRKMHRAYLNDEHWKAGRVTFRGLDPGTYWIKVLREDLTAVGMSTLEIPDTGSYWTEPLVEGHEFKVLLLDEEGAPMPSVFLIASPTATPGGDAMYAQTDAEGLLSLGWVPFETMSVRLMDASLGFNTWEEVKVPTNDEPVTLELERTHEMTFRAMDGDVPLSGFMVDARFEAGMASAVSLPTDASGVFRGGRTNPGTYIMRPESSWVWPDTLAVEAIPLDAEPPVLQFRRRGDLEVTVLNVTSSPAEGVEFELIDHATGEAMSDWIVPGGAASSTGGLISGPGGRATIARLPHGTFTWRVLGTDLQGEVSVPPLGKAALEITLE